MSRSTRPGSGVSLRVVLLLIVAVAAGYSGLSYYAGMRAQQFLQTQAQLSPGTTAFTVEVLEHQRGIWQSNGKIRINLRSVGQTSRSGPQRLSADRTLTVHYRIDHALSASHLARVQWTAEPAQALARQFAIVSRSTIPISGEGELDWQSQFDSSVAMPAFESRIGNQVLTFSPMQGQLRFDPKRLGLLMHWSRVQSQPDAASLQLEDVVVRADLSTRGSAMGTSQLEIGRMRWRGIEASQLGFTGWMQPAEVASNGRGPNSEQPYQDVFARAELHNLLIPGYQLQRLTVGMAMRGLDAVSLQTLQSLWSETAGLQIMTPEQNRRLRLAVRTLLLNGIYAQLNEIAAQSEFGEVVAQLQAELTPVSADDLSASGQPVDFRKYLHSRGELQVLEQGISPTLTTLGLLTGSLIKTEYGATASYDLTDGALTVNGKPVPVQGLMQAINEFLNKFVMTETVR